MSEFESSFLELAKSQAYVFYIEFTLMLCTGMKHANIKSMQINILGIIELVLC